MEAPNSSKAFMLGVINSFVGGSGIPQNYAVDFTPFWFFRHPNMTSYKYAGYDSKKDKQLVFSHIKKASVSFAFVTTTEIVTNDPVNNLSFGFRTNLIKIRSKQDIEDLKAANSKVVRYLRDLDSRLNEAGIIYNPAVMTRQEYDKKLEEFLANEEKARSEEKNELAEILKRRAVFAVDGSAGYNSFFLHSSFSGSHFGRLGAWLTLSYSQVLNKRSMDKSYVNLYALGRYILDGTTIINGKYSIQNFFDFGGKLEFEFKNISVAYEYIYRADDNTNTFRSNGMVKYKISDRLIFSGAFGKNFGEKNNLISLLGLNWGLTSGNEQTKIVKE
ncbi:MAG: hypothetical protein NTV09_05225 [Bacteroidetes bacterium]|nr:hypothetical protein [Bacteroidota bacterium]